MDLIADRGRRVTVEELNTTKLLAHAAEQAKQRKLEDVLIVDVDAHHYESEHMSDILPFMENDVLKQLAMSARSKGGRGSIQPQSVGYQDMGGRVTRYPLRSSEKTDGKFHRDVQLGHRWMDAMSKSMDAYMRTPAFLEAMKNNTNAVVKLKMQADDLAKEMARNINMPTTGDISGLFERLHSVEEVILRRLTRIDERLQTVEKQLSATQPAD